jgi:hypothetical protein
LLLALAGRCIARQYQNGDPKAAVSSVAYKRAQEPGQDTELYKEKK